MALNILLSHKNNSSPKERKMIMNIIFFMRNKIPLLFDKFNVCNMLKMCKEEIIGIDALMAP